MSTAIAVVAGVAFQALGYLNLRVLATILAAVAVAVLGWLAQRIKAASDKRERWDGRMSVIQEALAIWPPCRVEAVGDRVFDAGLYPAARETSGASDPGPGVEMRLRPGEIVLIVGPAGSAKSELALRMLRDQIPEAWMIVPDGARGLQSLLCLDPPLAITAPQSAVLLLDGCERFLEGLRLGDLDELRARCERLFVVATMREDELEALLGSADEIGYVARRFVARARLVPLLSARSKTAGSSPESRPASRRLASQPRSIQAPLIAAPGVTEPQAREEAVLFGAPPRSVLRDWGVLALAAGALALAVGFAAVWRVEGLKQPGSMSTQLAALRNEADTCGSRSVYAPRSADAISQDRPVVVVSRDAGRCYPRRQSDELSVFVPTAGTLSQAYAFRPADPTGGEFEFTCSGTMPGDPCLTSIAGTSTYAITGAFTDTNTLASYPIEILRTGDGFRLAALQQSGSTGHGRGPSPTRLTDGATSVSVMPTTAYSVTQPLASQPPVFIAGKITSGSFDWPRVLRISVWSPSPGAQPGFDHACRALASGENLAVSFARVSGDFVTDLSSALRRYWTRIARRAGESCP